MSLAITGYGVVSAAGFGVEALSARLREGGTALRPGSRAALGGLDPGWVGEVPDPDATPERAGAMEPLPNAVAPTLGRRWAVLAAREALASAGIPGRLAGDRVALVFGTNLEDRPQPLDELVDAIARELELGGPRIALSMACASSTAGIGLARALLEADAAAAVLVGGSDVLTPRVIAAFRTLELLADGPCGPFGGRVGLSLGEGAGFVVLERARPEHAGLPHVLGEGLAADGHHPTSPEPRGRGLAEAIEAALASAGLEPDAIDHVDAHATGTAANDAAEARALLRVFGARLTRTEGALPVGAVKSILGHAQGAAGVLELITTLITRERGEAPHNPGFVAPARVDAPADPIAAARPQRRPIERVLATTAGFGGTNAALVLGPPGGPRSRASERRVTLLASAASRPEPGGRLPELDWRRAVRGHDLRAADRSTAQLTLVVARALTSVPGRRPRRQDIGLFVGLRRACASAVRRSYDQIRERGLERAAARGLATTLTVIPTGECATALELWGPTLTTCAASLSGLLALIAAAEQLRRRPTLAAIVAAVVDEDRVDDELPEGQEPREGACARVLGDGGSIELAGWAVAGPAHAEDAVARARAHACEPEAIPVRLDSSLASEALIELDARLGARPIVVLASAPTVASCAIVLRRARH